MGGALNCAEPPSIIVCLHCRRQMQCIPPPKQVTQLANSAPPTKTRNSKKSKSGHNACLGYNESSNNK